MRTFNVDVVLNGKITFEVKAKNIKDAQAKVDNLLKDISVKEAIENYNKTLSMVMRTRENKVMER